MKKNKEEKELEAKLKKISEKFKEISKEECEIIYKNKKDGSAELNLKGSEIGVIFNFILLKKNIMKATNTTSTEMLMYETIVNSIVDTDIVEQHCKRVKEEE